MNDLARTLGGDCVISKIQVLGTSGIETSLLGFEASPHRTMETWNSRCVAGHDARCPKEEGLAMLQVATTPNTHVTADASIEV